MSRSSARVVAAVLAAPALLWAIALVVIVTADLPPLGGAAVSVPIMTVVLLSLLGGVIAAVTARLGREHRGDAPPRRLVAATVSGTAVIAAAAVALALGAGMPAEPAIAEPAVADPSGTSVTEAEQLETEQRIVFGDHSEHAGHTP